MQRATVVVIAPWGFWGFFQWMWSKLKVSQKLPMLQIHKAVYSRGAKRSTTTMSSGYSEALSATKRLRDSPPKGEKLLLSYMKLHKPVTTLTIRCWIVSVLTASGVEWVESTLQEKSISISSHHGRYTCGYHFASSRLICIQSPSLSSILSKSSPGGIKEPYKGWFKLQHTS